MPITITGSRGHRRPKAAAVSSGVEYFADSFETGDKSEWSGTSGTTTVPNTDVAYNGTYYLRSAMATSGDNGSSVYYDYGTPSQIATQIRDYWMQFAVSVDAFTGSWVETKVGYVQQYDATQGDATFSNAFRDFQQIIAVNASGYYFVQIVGHPDDPANDRFINLNQNTGNGTTHGPTAGSWDVLRMQVVLDTDGTGQVGIVGTSSGSTGGTGIVRLWKNNTLILEYTNLNLIEGNANVGAGRILLTAHSGGTWSGSDTAMYWDDVYVTSSESLLPAMPSAPVSRTSTGDILDADYSTTALSPLTQTSMLDELGIAWTEALLPTGGPSGQPAYQLTQIPSGGEQFKWGHVNNSVAMTTGTTYYIRIRLKITGNLRATNWQGGGLTSPQNKWIIIDNGGAGRQLMNIDMQRVGGDHGTRDYDGSESTQTGAPDLGWYFDIENGSAVSPILGVTETWYNIQIEFRHGASGIWRCWVDNNNYASPTWDPGTYSLNPTNPGAFRLGGFCNHGLEPDGTYGWMHSDFEIGTAFNPNWHT